MFKFKELLELWRKDNNLTQAFHDSETMLENAYEMFRASIKALRENSVIETRKNVREMDVVINNYERDVRRKVLQHLAITGGMNIIPGLILTSIVIDLERIGDYTKNIADLAKTMEAKMDTGIFKDDILKIEEKVDAMFKNLLPILMSSDKERARSLVTQNWNILKKSDEIMNAIITEKDPKLSPGNAAATALYVRYLKRIAAHLINVGTSIVNPFENVGFRVEDDD